MLLGPGKFDNLQDIASIHVFVNFNPLFYENQWSLVIDTNSTPDHDEL